MVHEDGAFDPLAITLTGLGAGREVRLTASTEIGECDVVAGDVHGRRRGRVDLATTAPTEGRGRRPTRWDPSGR
ncbi:hypothetical protein NKG05_24495 [Oerskovia sp. M15]